LKKTIFFQTSVLLFTLETHREHIINIYTCIIIIRNTSWVQHWHIYIHELYTSKFAIVNIVSLPFLRLTKLSANREKWGKMFSTYLVSAMLGWW